MRLLLALLLIPVIVALASAQPVEPSPEIGGELLVYTSDGHAALGSCPLEKTELKASIFGGAVRAIVRQTFSNSFDQPVEAKYLFPLPEDAAVDSMTMIIGERRIAGEIQERRQARRTYERAKSEGRATSLLSQERPNCFTQRVANVPPGESIIVEISFVEMLDRRNSGYEWTFPLLAGPRYGPIIHADGDSASLFQDETAIPETLAAERVTITVDIMAAHAITDVSSSHHAVETEASDPRSVRVTLAEKQRIPNRDFVLRYETRGEEIAPGLVVHENERGVFFSLIVEPPARRDPERILPREVIFVIDSSGSMHGFPIEIAKNAMRRCIDMLGPQDTFNLLAFYSQTASAFPEPVPFTEANRATAVSFLNSLTGHGGTEMMPAVEAALAGPHDPERLRVVCFMTDGYIGNDYEILSLIRQNAEKNRVYSFGVGGSPNRFLLERMALLGRGEASYIRSSDPEQAEALAAQFVERIHAPILTDISIDWQGAPVADLTPAAIPDLFDAAPIMIHGRLTAPAEHLNGKAVLRGETAAGAYEAEIPLIASEEGAEPELTEKLWARGRIGDLMVSNLQGIARRKIPPSVREEIVETSIRHGVLSDFTSFVAVDRSEENSAKSITKTGTLDWLVMSLGLFLMTVGAVLFVRNNAHAA